MWKSVCLSINIIGDLLYGTLVARKSKHTATESGFLDYIIHLFLTNHITM